METHLATLNATLNSIASLQAATQTASHQPTPFTNAMLNTFQLDVLEYIRDADQLDAALFAYPPLPAETIPLQTSVATATSTNTSTTLTATVQYEDSLLPRLPEQRNFLPPTPLRKPASEENPYDSRTLLSAALKLVENYHRAPRARRHIKELLKHSTEHARESHRYKTEIAAAERDIARYTAAASSGATTSASQSSTAGTTSEQRDVKVLQKLKEDESREEMEIMALEEMERELKERRAALRRTPARAPAPVAQHENQEEAEEEEDATMHPVPDATNAVSAEDLADDATVRGESPSRAQEAETTGRVEAKEEGETDEFESSDELERVCEQIWVAQGDFLRVLAPDKETGTLRETLALLRAITQGHGAAGPTAVGDSSMASAATGTTGVSAVTTSSTTSSVPTAPLPIATPSPLSVHAAYALLGMLRSPAPHVRELSSLRAEADVWWRDVGREAFTRNGGTGPEVNENGEVLTFRAVYRLTAQKVLRIRHSGGGRQVSFA